MRYEISQQNCLKRQYFVTETFPMFNSTPPVIRIIITDHIRSRREGNVLTGVFFVHRGGVRVVGTLTSDPTHIPPLPLARSAPVVEAGWDTRTGWPYPHPPVRSGLAW